MESAKGKICPMMNDFCMEKKCAWWCSWAQDCAVPLTAGILADSDICRTKWNVETECCAVENRVEVEEG